MKPCLLCSLFALFFMANCTPAEKPVVSAPEALPVTPSAVQAAYQRMEVVGFIHFTVNTFTDKEWGYGDESPEVFNPASLDAGQWARVAREAGLKELILTTRHHDGFCLWPSAFTEHSVKNSLYRNGEGDVVREFVDACRANGLKVGFYLSPWDRNHPDYGKPEYITYYREQLKELLTNYGEVSEIWFDGANGGDGYYGGANEKRYIDKTTYYDWDSTFRLVKSLQPDIQIFSDAGPDIRWVGNEHGFAGSTFWSPINSKQLVIGGSDPDYLNTGEPQGDKWLVGQCDVSIRPGWFYHAAEDSLVKSPEKLMEIYLKSVGRNGLLLLNLPPDKRGLIHENDVASLTAWKQNLDRTFATNLALNAPITGRGRGNSPGFAPEMAVDGSDTTFWAAEPGVTSDSLELDLSQPTDIRHVVLQEFIPLGQRIQSFSILARQQDEWQEIGSGTTVGYKRIIPVENIRARHLKIVINQALADITLAEVQVF